jgi:hypothetical protein
MERNEHGEPARFERELQRADQNGTQGARRAARKYVAGSGSAGDEHPSLAQDLRQIAACCLIVALVFAVHYWTATGK